ncbi:kinetochore protein NDC80 [Cryptococcus deuterogattii 99/473]|uniref:Kinetochore protein NDC80 n=2 Tax=Cryptococcus deuterogattii TaxID=1859096 RepID=A0A0D0UYX6_9TREE|nr:kinetochore protein NDC80 [Cryptococcus deuterogattii R265]KIR29371.1 kinetochore protein NDC80 [Cryptococcus deuterogattii LA55]KIR34666.1 kinetochore protein NDC80 [Cryptococcus deuterogattii MMRL2647]KIR39399.1 kinetochore protein NDC80 [Cryptococcus deuterogattii Ram5]KIR73733.1 kinetochore protein NDC80 [Cryptococcus deuterogattii CA1014]KIR93225.1 kinetochore protein NDC80 [Cryptococcus deuterogattii CBS 10090]KIR99512.1 kinetochore protein NDC80 [Cryptococcus deuterogattii 2001/935-
MDFRRQTLASNGGSSHPQPLVPPSAVKKVGRLGPARQSLAPSQIQSRTSILGVSNSQENAPHGMMGSKKSTMPGKMGDRDQLMSASRGDGGIYGRTPQMNRGIPGSVRRSSVFTSNSQGRTSMAPGVYSIAYKDPRPLRDKVFQSNCMRNVNEYLISVRYPLPLTAKTLTSPTAKEFQSIFKFLVNDLVDPGAAWGKKFEDDTLSILKDLKYPGMDSVSKTALTAPGAPQSWPNMLAMLNWLVDLCKALDNWDDPEVISDPLMIPATELPLDYPNLDDRLLWDFAAKTYSQWFDGEAEEFDEAEQELEHAYDRMASATVAECEKLEREIQKRDVEIQQLHAQEPPLKKLEDEYVQLMSDKNKFISFLDQQGQKMEKIRLRISKVKEAVISQEAELEARQSELARIEQAVAAQNLTPDEVQRMNHERDSLTRSLEDLRNKISEASQFAYDQEMVVTKSMDRFEGLLTDYNSLAHQIGLLDSSLDMPSLAADVNYNLDVDLGAEELEEVKAVGVRMRSIIWQALQTCRETFRQEALGLGNGTIALEDEFDKLGQSVERQKEEVGNLEVRLKIVHNQAEDAQSQIASENSDTNKIITQLETEVTNMLAASQQGVLSTQSQLESTRIAFKELRHKTALFQDSVVAEVGEHIDAIIKAKEHTANSLKSIRALAETQ